MIKTCSKYFLILELLVKQADNMEMAMFLDYKLTRYEGKGFLKNLNIKNTWGLTVTSSEQLALDDMLDTCPLRIVKVENAQTDKDTIPEGPADVVAPTSITGSEGSTLEQAQGTSTEGERIGAICEDGSTSGSTGSGTCSGHGGVSEWMYATPEPQLLNW